MINPCPTCHTKPEPFKPQESLFLWKIECCGLSAIHPWFVGVIQEWNEMVKEVSDED
jgi:hypothetical protein